MEIKFGDIEYFTLLDLESKLKRWDYNKLGLTTLDKLRHEVDVKIKAIHLQDQQRREEEKKQKQ